MEYIYVKNNVLNQDFCEALINLFENNTDKHFQGYMGKNKLIDLSFKNSIEMYLPDEYQKYFTAVVQNVFSEYVNKFKHISGQFINESFRIKKYINDGKHFYDWHTDISSYGNSNRLLAIIFYLNEVENGGETAIKTEGKEIKIKPELGKVLIFPANFCYLHAGLPPISNSKYILTTFLCYK